MKKNYSSFLFLSLLLAISTLIVSCGNGDAEGDDKDATETEEEVDVSDMSALNLSEHGLNITVMLPSVSSSTGASLEPLVTHEDDGFRWEISLGDKFTLIVEDYANEKNLIAEEKKRIEGYDFFDIEYQIEEDNLIMYKRELPEGSGGKTTYHVYGLKKLNGSNIIFRSTEDGFHKPTVEDMVRTIKSAKENTAS